MVDVSDPAIAEAYQEVQTSEEVNWCLFGYTDNTQKVLNLVGKGNGGLEELKGHLAEDQCFYGYVKFITGDEESKRTKFLFLTWVGEKVSPLRRARISVHKADVKTIVKNFAVEVHVTTLDEVDEEAFKTLLVKAGGANYSGNIQA